ncbi:MAG: HAD family hydrolase [Alsobacter sp.]
MSAPTTVVFDIGNVLLDWDPRHLYRKLFADDAAIARFMDAVGLADWNRGLDRGGRFDDAVAALSARHPDHAEAIAAFHHRWVETVSGPIQGSMAVLSHLRASGVPDYAITNFSSEKFHIAQATWPALAGFKGVVVSGDEGLLKPEPAIYQVLFERYGLEPAACVFVDDSPANVAAAAGLGMHALHFVSAERFAADLAALGLPVPAALPGR